MAAAYSKINDSSEAARQATLLRILSHWVTGTVEAIYPQTRVDIDGETIDTSKHNYALTLAAGQFPPVNAFWSVTMYDGKTELLIKNKINRYLINSPMLSPLKKNPDGSFTIYTFNTIRRVATRKPTGCPLRMAQFT